jgi:hypothetical protein
VIGSAFADTLNGDDLTHNRLFGGAGFDNLSGGAGDDTLTGGGSNDLLFGGDGLGDTANYFGSAMGVTVALDGSAGVGGDAQGDLLAGIENLIGSSSGDKLTGDGFINRIDCGLGNDTVFGGGGGDVLLGGLGGDTVYGGTGVDEFFTDEGQFFATTDTVFGEDGNDVFHSNSSDLLFGGNGYDVAVVESSASTANLTGIEEATLTAGSASITVVAGELDNLEFISGSGGTVQLSDFINWTNTGMTNNGMVLWRFGVTELWISENCGVVGV